MVDDSDVAEFKQQCMDYLDYILDEIGHLPDNTYFITDDQVTLLNVRRVEPLDVE
jgi:hypothetical protein